MKAAAKGQAPGPRRRAKGPQKDADTRALEDDLSALLGLKVEIDIQGQGGTLKIHYKTLDQLDDVLHRLNHAPVKSA